MTNTTNFRHIEMDINGHVVQNWADEDPPVEFEGIDMVDVVFGRDGAMYVNDKAMLGGEVKIMLLPTSPTALRCIRWFAERQNDRRLTFEATYQDTALNYGMRMVGGVLKQCDPIIVPGKTYEATFVFERFIPDVDGARFNPPPAAAGG